MLVLTRKVNEDVRIGDGVRVTVTAIRGNRVRIGIDAPADMTVLRGEVVKRGEKKEGSQE